MGVSAYAYYEYINQPLKSFDWMKKLTRAELEDEVTDMRPPPYFATVPWDNQLVCFLLGVNRDNFLYFVDLGGGKTKIILDITAYRKAADGMRCALILVPNVVSIESWMDEAKVHQPNLRLVGLSGSTFYRRDALKETDVDAFVINYQGLLYLVSTKMKVKGKQKLVIDDKLFKAFAERFDLMAMDEAQIFKNHQSLTYRVLKRMAKQCKWRYGTTGTPGDPEDLWAQFNVIDDGATLGRTLAVYRMVYFSTAMNYWGGREYTFKKKLLPDLHRRIKNRSIAYSEAELPDLPPLVPTVVPLVLPIETRRYYAKLAIEFDEARRRGDNRQLQNSFLRMRQLSAGFLTVRGEDLDKATIEFAENPKIDWLYGFIPQLPRGRKVVIFHDYIWTGRRIGEALKDMGVKHTRLWSGTRDKKDALRKFLDDPTYRAFVVNSASGSSVLNLQVANYHVFFECPLSPITRAQAKRRTRRSGQKADRVFQYDLVMRGTKDEDILAASEAGINLMHRLLNKPSQRDLFDKEDRA